MKLKKLRTFWIISFKSEIMNREKRMNLPIKDIVNVMIQQIRPVFQFDLIHHTVWAIT